MNKHYTEQRIKKLELLLVPIARNDFHKERDIDKRCNAYARYVILNDELEILRLMKDKYPLLLLAKNHFGLINYDKIRNANDWGVV